MGTYIIIGGDGKEYGPISSADIRQWVVEGSPQRACRRRKKATMPNFGPSKNSPNSPTSGLAAPVHHFGPLPSASQMGEDYELDIGGCISRGWELTKTNFGTLFVCILVFGGIKIALSSVINFTLVTSLTKMFPSAAVTVALGFLLAALNAPVMGPLLGGIYQ